MQAIGRRRSALKRYFSGRIEGISVYHHALMAFAGWFFVFTAIDDTLQIAGSFIIQDKFLSRFILNVAFVSVFFVYPCSFAGWGLYHVKKEIYNLNEKLRLKILLVTFFGWIVSGFFFFLWPISVFVFLDLFSANSVLPLTTVGVGIVWLLLGTYSSRMVPLSRRIVIVASMLLLILSIKYMDWNPKKSFMRDLLQIRKGMTGVQVETIMSDQQKNFAQPESEYFLHLNPTYSGEACFRDNSGEDIGVIEFQDGHVVNVEYIPE